MFNRLRNKILILGMSVTSLVLVAAFVVIYTITYESIQRENSEKLNEAISNPFIPVIFNLAELSGITDVTDVTERIRESLSQFMIPSDYRPSFTLVLDEKGGLVSKHSFIDMSDEEYTEAAQKVWQQQDGNAPIRVGGRLWQYTDVSKNYYIIRTIQKSEFEYSTVDRNSDDIEMTQYTFLDVTESHQTLQNLFFTFLIVGVVTLIAVFVICLVFANHAVNPIKSAWNAQKRFIADASHELKTPLTIINSNYGALVSKRHETIESQIKWLNYIKDGTDRMDKLIGDLLYLAKTECLEVNADKKPNNISDIIQNELCSMEVAANEKSLVVKADIEPDVILNCEEEKIGQIIRILFDNAIKYSYNDGLIDIELKSDKHNVYFSVSNSGCGIPKEDLPKIFDRFYRQDSARTHNGGYGLGLSIAKAIVDSMSGKINVSSIEGEYAAFAVSIPIRQ